MNLRRCATVLGLVICCSFLVAAQQKIDTAAQLTTESAGKSSKAAMAAVFRVVCPSKDIGGTGFLHKSGRIITANHVVEGCDPKEVFVLNTESALIPVKAISRDPKLDLAILQLSSPLKGKGLELTDKKANAFPVGTSVVLWGFPDGYANVDPLLTVGYLAGTDEVERISKQKAWVWVVNAAINSGNSGGPLVSVEDNKVIGVVVSKLAPIPPLIESALKALGEQKSGFTYTETKPDGSKETVTEGQVVAMVLKYLRSQTQLVVGHAVIADDLRAFLLKEKVEP